MLPNHSDSTVLELGCGKGQLTIPLAGVLKSNIIAVDSSKESLRLLKRSLEKVNLEKKVTTVEGDLRNLELENGSVDGVVSNFFFGWVSENDAKRVVRNTTAALKNGSIMLHSDFLPLAHNPARSVAVDQGRAKNNSDPSVRWWEPGELCNLLVDSGLEDVRIRFFDWKILFDYENSLEQLKRWGATREFIKSRESELRDHGLELPRSFIITARKPW
jgi:cyclopropane fatty-acyl-phospholipid synthase-like methyltransferase